MKRDDLLKKMPMPKKSMPEQEAHDDLDALLADDHAEEEVPADPAVEMEPNSDEVDAGLVDIDDETLIAEMKRRGLIDDGEVASGEEV